MDVNAKIYVAGHRGLVGSALVNNLKSKGYNNIITRTHAELDLTDTVSVSQFFDQEKPDYVFLAAAKVGGIVANNVYRAEFIYENLMIQNNVVHQSYLNGVKKLLFLGSTCIYPKNCPQPMKEDYLLTDILEYTNEPYAIAKIAGIKLCESYNLQYGTNFISVMPTNLYGPNDNFDLEKSHVLPALIRKILLGKALEEGNWSAVNKDLDKLPIEGVSGADTEDAKLQILNKYGISKGSNDEVSVEIWGSGKPRREFLWSEDMADACVFIMQERDFSDTYEKNQKYIRNTHINIGTGVDISIKDLAQLIKEQIDFKGTFVFNTDKPDGTMVKRTDVAKLNGLGWKHKIDIQTGIMILIDWYLNK
ncbi:NAD-dependent epimerase/dehydratase family protein [Muricauda sp. JGD-17]|uniref:GDP-L-fucose synthase n=1 Tax=Flagellimonas ochracea TaxID=2696472 RepID=A0A964WWY0_9FLAO|nr:GDP-L-fucose synthase [Allomuricauda ochracea]NAY91238.1 NAD-dependent epimerase/dehydratase family protein [Allomuricauda ochracea]